MNRDSVEDADGPVELLSTGWHRYVWTKATWVPCDTPENSDSEAEPDDEEEEEDEDEDKDEDEEDEDREDEDEEKDDEEEQVDEEEEQADEEEEEADIDEEEADYDEEPEEEAVVAAEGESQEQRRAETAQMTLPIRLHARRAGNPETDLEEIEADPVLRSRADQLQPTRKRKREGDHGMGEWMEPEAKRRRLK